mmetsp:Transcript_45422/g.115364  ORF Transcript_45422/g.115364 Transcript_45422/m.115364 type:complete len:221 (+) Transcript_45422:813-1475(+)
MSGPLRLLLGHQIFDATPRRLFTIQVFGVCNCVLLARGFILCDDVVHLLLTLLVRRGMAPQLVLHELGVLVARELLLAELVADSVLVRIPGALLVREAAHDILLVPRAGLFLVRQVFCQMLVLLLLHLRDALDGLLQLVALRGQRRDLALQGVQAVLKVVVAEACASVLILAQINGCHLCLASRLLVHQAMMQLVGLGMGTCHFFAMSVRRLAEELLKVR